MVEKPRECGAVSVYGKGQRVLPHGKFEDFIVIL